MDKEIIIDGCNVGECKYQSPNPHFFSNERFCNLFGKCKDRDCYYKQLQCKTAECEKYEQALKAIKKECKFVIDNRECYDLREADRCELFLNLINKVKDRK